MTSRAFCSMCCREEQKFTEHLANKEYSDAVKLIWRRCVTDTLLKVRPRGPHEVKLSVFLQETSDLMKESHQGTSGKGRPFLGGAILQRGQAGQCSPFHFSSKCVLISAFRSHLNRELALFIIYIIPRCSRPS